MNEICRQIQIVPLLKCRMHEGTLPKLVDQIAGHLSTDGIMKNPVIVTAQGDGFVILDGMHRFAALRKLNVRDILVYGVDYASSDVAVDPPHTKEDVLRRAANQNLLPPKSTRHRVTRRPLRVDCDLALLREEADLADKNRRLQDHLQTCLKENRARFYPESVVLFSD